MAASMSQGSCTFVAWAKSSDFTHTTDRRRSQIWEQSPKL